MDPTSRIYPCDDCGLMRSQNEGGTTFAVCDACWDRHRFAEKSPKKEEAPPVAADDAPVTTENRARNRTRTDMPG